MRKCQYCGYENSDSLDYCMQCSKTLPIVDTSNDVEDNSNRSLNDLYNISVEDINDKSNNLNNQHWDFILNDDKEVFISTLLSLIIPGSGLIYLKKQRLGFIIITATIILWSFSQFLYIFTRISIVNIALSLSLILYFFGVVYTFKLADYKSREKIR